MGVLGMAWSSEGHTGACDGISRQGQSQSSRTDSHRHQPLESGRGTELESLRKRGSDHTAPGPSTHLATPGFWERRGLWDGSLGVLKPSAAEHLKGGPPGFLTIACVPVTSSHLRGRGEAGSKRL